MRYDRQIKVIGKEAQQKLAQSTVAIIGLGALGSPAAQLLTRAGIGKLILVDRDIVETTNLQRQQLFREADVGLAKADVIKRELELINSEVAREAHAIHLDKEQVSVLKKADLIIDATDNITTRMLINVYAKEQNIPWIYSAGIKQEGYVFFNQPQKACIECILPQNAQAPTCAQVGVLAATTTIIACLAVTQAINYLTGKEVEHDLLHLNLKTCALRKLKVKQHKDCPKKHKTYPKEQAREIARCAANQWLFRATKERAQIRKALPALKERGSVLKNERFTIFPDNRVLITAKTKQDAQILFSKYIGN